MSRPPIGDVRWLAVDAGGDTAVAVRVEITGGGPLRTVYRHLDNAILRGQRQSMETRDFGRCARESPSAALVARALILGAAADRAKAEAQRLEAEVARTLKAAEAARSATTVRPGNAVCPGCAGRPFGPATPLGCPRCRGQGEIGPSALVKE